MLPSPVHLYSSLSNHSTQNLLNRNLLQLIIISALLTQSFKHSLSIALDTTPTNAVMHDTKGTEHETLIALTSDALNCLFVLDNI